MKSRRAYGFGSSSGGQKDEVDATASYEDRLNYNLIYMKNKQELTQIQPPLPAHISRTAAGVGPVVRSLRLAFCFLAHVQTATLGGHAWFVYVSFKRILGC